MAFRAQGKPGDKVVGGDILGTVQETEIVEHRIMVKPGVVGTVKSIAEGDYTVTEQIGSIETANGEELPVTLMQKWPCAAADRLKRSLRRMFRLSPVSASLIRCSR